MLKIWFRSQPAQSTCRCISCLSSGARILARRPTASAEPWRLQFKHLTTLFYSSIIATAAAADAGSKQRRREQWAIAIAEAERSIQELKERSDASQHPYPDDVTLRQEENYENTLGGAVRDARGRSHNASSDNATPSNVTFGLPLDLGRPAQMLPRIVAEVKRSSEQTHHPNGSARKYPFVVGISKVAPTSIYASHFQCAKWRPSWSSKKIVTLELSIAKLTTQFLIKISPETSISNDNQPPVNELSARTGATPLAIDRSGLKQRLADISTRLKNIESYDADGSDELESTDYPRYTPDIEGWTTSAVELNRALILLLRSFAKGNLDIEGTLSKISYNLLISPTPPDLKTYTILMTRFSRLGYHDLASMVVESLFESHIRSDEMTVSGIIAHYSRTGDLNAFTRFVQKLEGYYGGLMLARSNIPTEGVGASRLRSWKDKVIQKIGFDPYMYYGVIAAYLKFDKLDLATHWYDRMIKDGLEADVQLLTDFLRYFTKKLDWTHGYGIWQNIKLQLLDGGVEPRKVKQAYIFMLQHCKECSQLEYFKNVRDEASKHGVPKVVLFIPRSIARGFSYQEDSDERLRRKGRVLKHRFTMITETVRAWAVQVLAAKIILWDLNMDAVQEVFRRHADQHTYEDWLRKRPWLWNPKRFDVNDPAPARFTPPKETKQAKVETAVEKTFRFGSEPSSITTSAFNASSTEKKKAEALDMEDRSVSDISPASLDTNLDAIHPLQPTSSPDGTLTPLHSPSKPKTKYEKREEKLKEITPQHLVQVPEQRRCQGHKPAYAEKRYGERQQTPVVVTYG